MNIQPVSSRYLRRTILDAREALLYATAPPTLPAEAIKQASELRRRRNDYDDRQFLKERTADGYQ